LTNATHQRDVLLLSHANPDDNEFTLWLALQLANEGYNVWSDVTRLLGGEVFWNDIEEVIRQSAAKVLFVLSRNSNNRDGALRELHLAQGLAKRESLKDFVIPLHIDDLPHSEVTIELTRVNAVPFEKSWAAGLATLLKKLEEDAVPKNPNFNPTAVNQWWRTKFSAEEGVRSEAEEYLSNWFEVSLPEHVYFHTVARKSIGKIELIGPPPYPAVQHGISLITFAKARDFEGKLDPDFYIAQESPPLAVRQLLDDSDFGKHLFRCSALPGNSRSPSGSCRSMNSPIRLRVSISRRICLPMTRRFTRALMETEPIAPWSATALARTRLPAYRKGAFGILVWKPGLWYIRPSPSS
jgi:hypothetical protein